MSKKLYWAIDINNPASWEEVEEGEVLDINNEGDFGKFVETKKKLSED